MGTNQEEGTTDPPTPTLPVAQPRLFLPDPADQGSRHWELSHAAFRSETKACNSVVTCSITLGQSPSVG
jgi:hypothetical protein